MTKIDSEVEALRQVSKVENEALLKLPLKPGESPDEEGRLKVLDLLVKEVHANLSPRLVSAALSQAHPIDGLVRFMLKAIDEEVRPFYEGTYQPHKMVAKKRTYEK